MYLQNFKKQLISFDIMLFLEQSVVTELRYSHTGMWAWGKISEALSLWLICGAMVTFEPKCLRDIRKLIKMSHPWHPPAIN